MAKTEAMPEIEFTSESEIFYEDYPSKIRAGTPGAYEVNVFSKNEEGFYGHKVSESFDTEKEAVEYYHSLIKKYNKFVKEHPELGLKKAVPEI